MEVLQYRQLEFGGLYKQSEIVASRATSVLFEIIKKNPEIKLINYFSYDMRIDSDDELVAFGLKRFSPAKITRRNFQTISNIIQKQDSNYALGIASMVVLKDDTVAHIPMIDFMSRKLNPSLNIQNIQQALKPFPGYLLETGNSLHYWGKQILSENGWKFFMKYSKETLRKSNADICEGFYDFSIKRGFSGLRLFAYPPYKKIAPYVVAEI